MLSGESIAGLLWKQLSTHTGTYSILSRWLLKENSLAFDDNQQAQFSQSPN